MKPFQRMLGSVHLYAGESRVGGQPGVGWEARVGGFTPLCSWGQWTQRNTLLRVWASIWACQTAPGPRACPRGRRCLWFRGGRTVSSRVKAKVPMWLRSLNYPRCLLSLAVSHIQRASFFSSGVLMLWFGFRESLFLLLVIMFPHVLWKSVLNVFLCRSFALSFSPCCIPSHLLLSPLPSPPFHSLWSGLHEITDSDFCTWISFHSVNVGFLGFLAPVSSQ